MKFFNSVKERIKLYFFSTDHKDIGMLYFIFQFLKNQRNKFLYNSESKVNVNHKNLPLGLLLIFLGYIAAGVVSFTLVNSYIGPEIFQIQPGTGVSNEIPFEKRFPDWLRLEDPVLDVNEIPFENLILDADTGIWRNYVYDNYDNNIVNEEVYRYHLQLVGSEARTEDAVNYDCLLRYRQDIATTFNEECEVILMERVVQEGYLGVLDGWSIFLETYINLTGNAFKTSMKEFRGQVVVTPILEQKLQILMNYGETPLENFQQQRIQLVESAWDDIQELLAEWDMIGAREVLADLHRSLETLFFQTYQTRIEMETFFKNLSKEYGQGVAPRELPFVKVHQAGNLDRIPMQIVIDKKILCDDDVYCPKE